MKLEVFQNGRLLQEIPLHGNDVWVGRDEACVIRLDDRAISRKHVLFRSTAEGLAFEKKSKFGWVKVNGHETAQANLKDGDRLELGPYEIHVKNDTAESPKTAIVAPSQNSAVIEPSVQVVHEEQKYTDENLDSPTLKLDDHHFESPVGVEMLSGESQPIEVQPFEHRDFESSPSGDASEVQPDGVTKVFNSPTHIRPILQFSDGAANVTQYEIADDKIIIGRSQQCHVVLEDKRSSRQHAVIRKVDSKYFIKDQGSANGTLVNGEKIDDYELQSGDEIKIGDTSFIFQMVQADYEVKKEQFIPVPAQESESINVAPTSIPPMHHSSHQFEMPPQPEPGPAFQPMAEAPKKSFIGKFLDNYRMMSTKKQVIYGVAILAGIWYMLDDEPDKKAVRLNAGPKKVLQKKDNKQGALVSFESLTPEQQRYVETQYQISFDLYKNRDYDKSLLEVSKIFSLLQDYKNAREIESFAREGKRKLEAQEEERKKKEQERQAQLKLQSLLEQTGLLMEKKRFKEAESLFPEIELLQPENAAVSEWRKMIISESEKLEQEAERQRQIQDINKKAWADYQKGMEHVANKRYVTALLLFDEILERSDITDQKLLKTVKTEINKTEGIVASIRDPLLAQGKQLEQDGKLSEAYRAFEQAAQVDSDNEEAPAGMKRIHGTLTARARYLYTEGVFAESYSDLDGAEKRYREVMEVVPKDDDYYVKANNRLKRLTVFKKPQGDGEP